MKDNAACQVLKETFPWLKLNKIEIILWSVIYSDFNFIKHVCYYLEKFLQRHYEFFNNTD